MLFYVSFATVESNFTLLLLSNHVRGNNHYEPQKYNLGKIKTRELGKKNATEKKQKFDAIEIRRNGNSKNYD